MDGYYTKTQLTRLRKPALARVARAYFCSLSGDEPRAVLLKLAELGQRWTLYPPEDKATRTLFDRRSSPARRLYWLTSSNDQLDCKRVITRLDRQLVQLILASR